MTKPRTSTGIHSVTCGSLDPIFGSMEAFSPKRVDPTGCEYGVQAPLVCSPSAPHSFPDSLSGPCLPGSRGDFGSRDSALVFKGGSGDDFSFPWLLRTNICSPEEQRGFSPSPRPVLPEQVPRAKTLQDGDPVLHQGFDPPRGLGDDPRSSGCILPCLNPSERQEVPPLLLEGQGFSVQSPPLWPLPSSLGLHESNQGVSDLVEVERNQSTHVPGRLANVGSVFPALFKPLSASGRNSEQFGVLPSLGEVIARPIPEVHIPGHGLRHCSLLGGPHRGTSESFCVPEGRPSSVRESISSSATFLVGTDGVNGVSPSPGASLQAGVPETTQCALEPIPRLMGCSDSSAGLASTVPHSVDGHGVASFRRPDLSALSRRGAVHRCFFGGLGCPCSPSDCSGHLVSGGEKTAHKCSGTGGSSPGYASICPLPSGEGSFAVYRQYDRDSLRKQTGGHEGPIPVHTNRGSSASVSGPGYSASSSPHTGQAQHYCRFPQQAPLCFAHRMDPDKENSSTCVGCLAQTHGGPLCHQIQPSTGPLCVPSTGPRCLGSGRPLHQLEGFPRLRLPAHSDTGQGYPESQKRSGCSDSHLPALASATMVPRPSTAVSRSTVTSLPEQESACSAEVRNPSRESLKSQPPRMAAVRGNLHALGASNKVLELVGLAHRPGTNAVYSSHWERWLKWCEDQSVSPLHLSSVDLANFLGFLASEGKATATIRVYRAAVCTTLRQLGGPSFQEDPLIRDTLRGSALLEARSPRRVPAWDLNCVLSFLKSPQFEPLNSLDLKSLTLKTTFLLALASGRRVSEINHLSGMQKDVGLSSEGSFVLKFLPEFLAKNQSPGSPSPSLTIPQLLSTSAGAPIDISLCPVRALKRYRQVTKPIRGSRRKMLISFNKSYHKDISVATISRWIREVIRDAYAAEDRALPNPRAHEVRAWATSLALFHSCSIADILEAAYWSSTSPFIRCYLRDVSIAREDGSYAFSCVAAQSRLPLN